MNATLETFIHEPRIAYFSMEIAFHPDVPTYSGGLGVLAGDTARSAADLELPMVFVTLISRRGYLRQEIGRDGRQSVCSSHSPLAGVSGRPTTSRARSAPALTRLASTPPLLKIRRSSRCARSDSAPNASLQVSMPSEPAITGSFIHAADGLRLCSML